MFNSLIPRSEQFFKLFEEHASVIVEAARHYHHSLSQEKIRDLSPIKELEHKADLLTQTCHEALHKTFITPIDRDQIYHLVKGMDDIIDSIDALAEMLLIYKIEKATPELKTFAGLILNIVLQLEEGVRGLRHLNDFTALAAIQKEIHSLEHEADLLLGEAIGRLFDNEKEAKEIIKWKELYEISEKTTDECLAVIDLIEGIFLENI